MDEVGESGGSRSVAVAVIAGSLATGGTRGQEVRGK